jgi:hypothetical protein
MVAVGRAATLISVYFAKKCIGLFLKITTETNKYLYKHYEAFTLQRKLCLFIDGSSLCVAYLATLSMTQTM